MQCCLVSCHTYGTAGKKGEKKHRFSQIGLQRDLKVTLPVLTFLVSTATLHTTLNSQPCGLACVCTVQLRCPCSEQCCCLLRPDVPLSLQPPQTECNCIVLNVAVSWLRLKWSRHCRVVDLAGSWGVVLLLVLVQRRLLAVPRLPQP